MLSRMLVRMGFWGCHIIKRMSVLAIAIALRANGEVKILHCPLL